MDVRHLSLLRELAERGSVAAVATATHRTPSAVSQQLRSAERELGVRLVEPDGRGVRLTDAGRLLAGSAADVEAALARTQARLDQFRGDPAGSVTIAALPSAAEFLLPSTLAGLARSQIALELTDLDVSESDFARLTSDYDLVVGHSLTGPVPAGAAQLTCATVVREPIDVALPAGHPLAERDRLRPREVADQKWIAVPDGFPFATILGDIERRAGRHVEVVQRLRDNRVIEALVAAGQGIALLPRFTTRGRAGIALRPLREVNSRRWIVAMSRPDKAERQAVRTVIRALQRAGREHAAR